MGSIIHYSNNEINNAGKIVSEIKKISEISKKIEDTEETRKAKEIFYNFRMNHKKPMEDIMEYVENVSEKLFPYDNFMPVSRLKNPITIINKVYNNKRRDNIKLSQMCDIGGVRIVVNNVKQLNQLKNYLENDKVYNIEKIKDYTLNPKETGYSGIHIIYTIKDTEYSKCKIELQLRTKLQHIWATTLESYDAFNKTSLKTEKIKNDWTEFFELASSLFAWKENRNLLPQHKNIKDVITDIKKLKYQKIKELNIINNHCKEIKHKKYMGNKILLIVLHEDSEPTIKLYEKRQFKKAKEAYKKLSNDFKSVIYLDINNNDLIKMYPNFFLNTRTFIDIINSCISIYKLHNETRFVKILIIISSLILFLFFIICEPLSIRPSIRKLFIKDNTITTIKNEPKNIK